MSRDERGVATVELILLTPVILVILMLVVGAGRLGTIQGELAGVARDAARAASIQPTYEAAEMAAVETATAVLAQRQVQCQNPQIQLGPSTDIRAGGAVTVQIDCTVQLSDLAVPGLPGSRTIGAESVEVIDTYRWVPND